MDASAEVGIALPRDPAARLAAAAQLVQAGAVAFVEGNPWRARKVRDDATVLLQECAAQDEALLRLWPGGSSAGGSADLLLAPRVEGLAKAAHQLGGLAESRPSTRSHSHLIDAFQSQLDAVVHLLGALAGTHTLKDGLEDALDQVRRRKEQVVEACMAAASKAPRSFPQAMLAAAAATRLDEAAEHAAEAVRVMDRASV